MGNELLGSGMILLREKHPQPVTEFSNHGRILLYDYHQACPFMNLEPDPPRHHILKIIILGRIRAPLYAEGNFRHAKLRVKAARVD
ncbi:MAG TPA: hypothetical protein VFG20_10400 [Planctomycetaceae bacterium]|nr:hypothetical protein [Planctomycetaceae bacterium]